MAVWNKCKRSQDLEVHIVLILPVYIISTSFRSYQGLLAMPFYSHLPLRFVTLTGIQRLNSIFESMEGNLYHIMKDVNLYFTHLWPRLTC